MYQLLYLSLPLVGSPSNSLSSWLVQDLSSDSRLCGKDSRQAGMTKGAGMTTSESRNGTLYLQESIVVIFFNNLHNFS